MPMPTFHALNRLGATSNSITVLCNTMNAKTSLACENEKAAGIIVYIIAFNILESDTVQMLHDCATSPSNALAINVGIALIAAFEAIAQDINRLGISG